MGNNILYFKRSGERGNALFLILIAVALFAALSFVVTQSSRSGGGDASRERARLAAADVQNQATAIQTAVTRLLIAGCQASQLSFESGLDTDHVNPTTPVDGHCRLFESARGASVPPRTAEAEWVTDKRYYYSGSSAITNLGTTCTTPDCADLTMNLWGISQALCMALNDANGFKFTTSADIPSDTQQGCPFKGTFDCNGNNTAQVIFAAPELRGKKSFCYNDTVKGFSYTHVILER